jgi:hypothetical protein
MQRKLISILVFMLIATSGFCINRRMMEDKILVGAQASVMLPMELDDHKYLNSAFGGGLRGKYFGTNTFAFGFDLSFFAPKIQLQPIKIATDSLKSALLNEQRFKRIHDSVQILDVSGRSQYIPFNISFEFYLPKRALDNFRPYAALGIGLNIINRRYGATYNAPKTEKSGIPAFENRVQLSSNKGYVSINPTIGFLWTLDELWNITADLRYNSLLTNPLGSGALSFHFGVILDLSFKYVR